MEQPGQLRELFRMQRALKERIGVRTEGMSADDVFNACVRKNEVNFRRQENGYTVKDEHDSKHI
jgi:hypothetical protein